jgi:hypothetical protein
LEQSKGRTLKNTFQPILLTLNGTLLPPEFSSE